MANEFLGGQSRAKLGRIEPRDREVVEAKQDLVSADPTASSSVLSPRPENLTDKVANGMRCFPVIASGQQSNPVAPRVKDWIASSQELLAMTGKQPYFMGYISSPAR